MYHDLIQFRFFNGRLHKYPGKLEQTNHHKTEVVQSQHKARFRVFRVKNPVKGSEDHIG
jgi:hypothetical protein